MSTGAPASRGRGELELRFSKSTRRSLTDVNIVLGLTHQLAAVEPAADS